MSPEKLTNPFSSLTVEQGLVRNIGVSNWNCQGLRDLVSYAKIKPAVLQVHAQLKMLMLMPSSLELISKLSGKEGQRNVSYNSSIPAGCNTNQTEGRQAPLSATFFCGLRTFFILCIPVPYFHWEYCIWNTRNWHLTASTLLAA